MIKYKFKVGDWIISKSGKSRAFRIDNKYNIHHNNICSFPIHNLRYATAEEIKSAELTFDNNIVEDFPFC